MHTPTTAKILLHADNSNLKVNRTAFSGIVKQQTAVQMCKKIL